MSEVIQPFEVFYDTDGKPLEDGYIYVGLPNLNPQTSPTSVYWDENLTIPASQPLRTINGYFSRYGTPGKVYTALLRYSITVRDKKGELVYSSLDAVGGSGVQSMAYLSGSNGLGLTGTRLQVPIGTIINVSYFDSNEIFDSRGAWRYTGVTDGSKPGYTPAQAADGYAYDAGGRQYQLVGEPNQAQFGSPLNGSDDTAIWVALFKHLENIGGGYIDMLPGVSMTEQIVLDQTGFLYGIRGRDKDACIIRMIPIDLNGASNSAGKFWQIQTGVLVDFRNFTSDHNRSNMINLPSPPNANHENLDFSDPADGCVVDNCLVLNSIADGIDLDTTSRAQITNNYVSVAGKGGIHLSTDCEHNMIRGNTVELCEDTQRGGITQSENSSGYNSYIGNISRNNTRRNYDIRESTSDGSTATFAGNQSGYNDSVTPATGDVLEGVTGEAVAVHNGTFYAGNGTQQLCVASYLQSGIAALDETFTLPSGWQHFRVEIDINIQSGGSLYMQINGLSTAIYSYLTMASADGAMTKATGQTSILVGTSSARRMLATLRFHAGQGTTAGTSDIPISADVSARTVNLVWANAESASITAGLTSIRLFTSGGDARYAAIRVYAEANVAAPAP